jgi:predicted RNA-binding Zn-ribbon protein involved in translation (DUF1610 family)
MAGDLKHIPMLCASCDAPLALRDKDDRICPNCKSNQRWRAFCGLHGILW